MYPSNLHVTPAGVGAIATVRSAGAGVVSAIISPIKELMTARRFRNDSTRPLQLQVKRSTQEWILFHGSKELQRAKH